MRHLFFNIFSFWVLYSAFGQTTIPPIIDSVSVQTTTGGITIGWHDENTSSVEYYIVTRLDYKSNPDHPPSINIDTIAYNTTYVYTDITLNASEGPVAYRMYINDGEFSTIHKTVFLKSRYDSCNAAIQLSWSEYEGWSDVKEYKIIDLANNSVIGITSDTIYTITNVEADQVYSFFIRAISTDNKTSSSNVININTDRPDPPTFIDPEKILANENMLDINLYIDPHSQIKKYELIKSDNASMENSYIIDTISAKNNHVSYSDSNFNPNNISYYQLQAIDGCQQSAYLSQPFFNIVINISQNGDIINIDFTDGNIWQTSNIAYKLYRSDEFGTYSIIDNTTDLFYTDNINNLMGNNFNTKICYFIETVNQTNNFTNTTIQACINIEPEIFTPSSFNPKSNINNYFLPIFSFLPNKYELVIINKAGNVVFSSKNPTEKWFGENMPSGTYIYTIKYNIDGKKNLTKSGIVNLFTTN